MEDPYSFAASEDAVPPSDVRINELHIEKWPDRQRIRVHIDITPFQKRPDLEATIFDADGNEIANTLIIETLENRLVFTMHLRPDALDKELILKVVLSYRDLGIVDEKNLSFMTHSTGPLPE